MIGCSHGLGSDRGTETLRAVGGTGPGDVYAVGDSGTILHSTDSGKTWQRQRVDLAARLNGIWADTSRVYVVGDNQSGTNAIFTSTDHGKTWVRQPGRSDACHGLSFSSVVGDGRGTLFAVGLCSGSESLATGVFASRDHGATWTPLAPAAQRSLMYGLWARGDELFAVGEDVILHSVDRARTWSARSPARKQASPEMRSWASATYRAVWGDASSARVVVGDGALESSDRGSTWTRAMLPEAVGGELNAVWGPALHELYAVGKNGALLKRTDRWRALATGLESRRPDLFGIWGSSGADVFAVGEGGTIIHSTDGGKTWSLQHGTGEKPKDLFVVPIH